MRRHTTLTLGIGLVFCFGLLSFGCADDGDTTKKDAGSGGSAKGGSGGGAGAGGSSARGGSGGSAGAGGSSAKGGSGGSAGAGGSSARGGSGGSGGDGGPSDRPDGSNDAVDAPLVDDDGGPGLDMTESDSTPVLIDAEGLDTGEMDTSPIDTMVVMLDLAPDTADAAADLPGPDLGPDLARDLPPNPLACSTVQTVSIGAGLTSHTYQPNTNTAFCFATCDDIAGWTCSQMGSRQVYLDGELISNCASNPPIPAKVGGSYHVFQVTAGTESFSSITWWMSTAATGMACLAPDGGFGLD